MTHPSPGLELPTLSTDSPPLFADADSCRDWLATLTANPAQQTHQTQALLLRQLNLLNRYALPAAKRFILLELLRGHLHVANADAAQRFSDRPLPLTPPELAAFDTCQTLWQALETGYLHCVQEFAEAAEAADKNTSQALTRAAGRALACLAAAHLDACQAAMLPAPGFWLRLHQIYHLLEQRQLTQMAIDDEQRSQSATTTPLSCASLYVEILLLAAAHPIELEPSQRAQLVHWSRSWAHKPALQATPPADRRTPPLLVDLATDAAAAFKTAATGATLRWLDMTALRLSIKQTLTALEKGVTSTSNERAISHLSPAVNTASAGFATTDDNAIDLALLRQVYQDWCRGGRHDQGRKHNGACLLIADFDRIHQTLNRAQTAAHSTAPVPDNHAAIACERWQKTREHVTHVCLQRPLNQPGKRLMRGQLLALCMDTEAHHDDPPAILLGKLRWLAINSTRDALLVHMQLLPGQPQAITFMTCAASASAQTGHGFLLPAIPALDKPATLLLPPSGFGPGNTLRVSTPEGHRQLYLHDSIDSGADFVRCTFSETAG